MQPTAEISHKIRLAIKTKLTELGAYVDDELPDYVLVMVANRRGRQDMKKELELFLGEATDRFCSWLFGVLDKLKDAKKNTKDKRQSDNEQGETRQTGAEQTLDDYDEEETVTKKVDNKVEKKVENRSRVQKSKSPKSGKKRNSRRSKSDSRSRDRSRSKSRDRSRDMKKEKDKKRKDKSHSRERKKKKRKKIFDAGKAEKDERKSRKKRKK
jgi:hypothetical protein